VPDESLATRDVFVTMAAIATATESIMIGTGLTNPYSRNPALTAGAIATIDELSEGRAFLCYGAGGTLALGPLGLARTRPLAHVREAIEVSRRLFNGESVVLEGDTIDLDHASLCVGRADLEIWFAGRGARMLRQAGAIADGVLLEFLHKPNLGDYLAHVAEGAQRTGNRPRLCYATTVVTDRARFDDIRPQMSYRIVDSPPAVKEILGISDADTAAIKAAMREGLDAAAELIPDEWIEPFVIAGSTSECATELGDVLATHGFDEFMLVVADMAGAEPIMIDVAEIVGEIG
jgi:5,10-methylenetetrahydromethanopterin reductase